MVKRQPNKKYLDSQNVKNDEKNNRLSSSTECSSTTSNSNSSDLTQTINDLSDNNDIVNVTRQIPVVKSNKKMCIIGDSNIRGLAKQLKPKFDNPDAVCVYKTSGMRIEHLIPRIKGYICEDTDAAVLHLGTNAINGSVNKVKEDINRLADKMKGFQNTHFYVAEIPPRKQICPHSPHKLSHTWNMCKIVQRWLFAHSREKTTSLSWWNPLKWGGTANTNFCYGGSLKQSLH